MKNLIISLCVFLSVCLGTTLRGQSCTGSIRYSDTLVSYIYTFNAVGNFSPAATFFWSLGDGTSSRNENVVKHYLVYHPLIDIRLTITDSVLGCADTLYDTIRMQNFTSPCPASFSSTHIDTFYTFSTINMGVPPFSYLWYLPDGSISTLPDPTYAIGTTHTYSGSVMVTDSTGCIDTVVYALNNTNSSGNSCQAYFYVVPDSSTGSYTVVDCSFGTGLSYLWYFGDGSTSSLQYPTHSYAVPGYYNICLSVSSGSCSSIFCDSNFYAFKNYGIAMSEVKVIGKSATGIERLQAEAGITIYPNPATSTLAVVLRGSDKMVSSTIYNPDGQKVAEYGSASLLPIGQLSTGLYFIEVRTNNGSLRSTFVKE